MDLFNSRLDAPAALVQADCPVHIPMVALSRCHLFPSGT